MLLLLNRHANAGERDPAQWPDDRDRPLTDKGRKVQRDVSRALRKLDLTPSLVLTSPWLRAAQTAEPIGQGLSHDLEPYEWLEEIRNPPDWEGAQQKRSNDTSPKPTSGTWRGCGTGCPVARVSGRSISVSSPA